MSKFGKGQGYGKGSVGRARNRSKKRGYKRTGYAMKFPEIVMEMFKKIWSELDKK